MWQKSARTLAAGRAFAPKLKIVKSKLRRLARQQITIVAIVRDAAGNEARTTRKVTLSR